MRAWWAYLLTVGVAAAGLVGCSGPAVGAESRARSIAESWLRDVSTPSADRGWRWLHPATQEGLYQDDAQRYRQEAAEQDWSGFRYSVRDTTEHDGEYTVTVRVEGGADAVPAFLLERGLIGLSPVAGIGQAAYVIVEIIDPGGPTGVLVIPGH